MLGNGDEVRIEGMHGKEEGYEGTGSRGLWGVEAVENSREGKVGMRSGVWEGGGCDVRGSMKNILVRPSIVFTIYPERGSRGVIEGRKSREEEGKYNKNGRDRER